MKVTLCTIIATVIAATSASAATADNYGGVSAKEKAAVTREVRRYWRGRDATKMLCIIGRESGFNKFARSRTNDHGLAQANIIWASLGPIWAKRYTITGGIEIAYRIWLSQGWAAWGGGAYRC